MRCNFGDNRDGSELKRRIICGANTNFNEIRDRDKGGPEKVILCPVATGPEKYHFLDVSVPIRAIYFPLASRVSAVNEDLCSYLMIDFRLRKWVQVRDFLSGKTEDIKFYHEEGLYRLDRSCQALCIDIPGVYALLSLPPQLRNREKGLYQAKETGDELFNLLDTHQFGCGTPPANSSTTYFQREIDLAKVISDNFGVNVEWTPYAFSVWVFDFIESVAAMGYGYIPIAGPLISVAFSLGLTAITDPEFFQQDNMLGLSATVMNTVVASGLNMRDNLPKGFLGKKMGSK